MTSTAGQQGQGGLQVDGNPNSPLLIRNLTSVVAVQNSLTSQTPSDVEIVSTRLHQCQS